MDCSLPGSAVHGIFQARVLEWGAIAFSNNDHEMPPKHGQICDYKGALLTESWPLPAASTKINSWPLQDADLQHPFERIETKNKVLCDLGKKEEKKKKQAFR